MNRKSIAAAVVCGFVIGLTGWAAAQQPPQDKSKRPSPPGTAECSINGTTLTTEIALDIGGAKVPAGKYTLYTLPSRDKWKLIINKQTGQWGTEYHEDQDLARVAMTITPIVVPVEQFTISLDQDNNSSADLVLEWEKTRLTVLVRAQAQ